jgi:YcaO-like protein with predicted kinase domain
VQSPSAYLRMRLFGEAFAHSKGYRHGMYRTRSAAETLRAYAGLAARTGVTRLANVTGLDRIGLPVYVGIRPNSRSLAVSQGKGLDDDSAKASALMEAIEFWHAEHLEKPARFESYAALRRAGERVLEFDLLKLQVGPSLARDRPLFWIDGEDLLTSEHVWVPFELVSLNFVRPAFATAPLAGTSNGLASGNHLLEALVHGLCELIERDASTLWFNFDEDGSGGKSSQIDPSTVTGDVQRVIELLDAAALNYGFYDTTSDIGIPSFQCVLFDAPGDFRAMGYFWGFGCHLDAETALTRAVTEAVQCRLTEIAGARDDISWKAYQLNRDEEGLAEMEKLVSTPPPRRPFEAINLSTDTLEGDVSIILEAMRRGGVKEVVAVDLRKEGLEVPVVKVIAPDLEGYPFKQRPGKRLLSRLARLGER